MYWNRHGLGEPAEVPARGLTSFASVSGTAKYIVCPRRNEKHKTRRAEKINMRVGVPVRFVVVLTDRR